METSVSFCKSSVGICCLGHQCETNFVYGRFIVALACNAWLRFFNVSSARGGEILGAMNSARAKNSLVSIFSTSDIF